MRTSDVNRQVHNFHGRPWLSGTEGLLPASFQLSLLSLQSAGDLFLNGSAPVCFSVVM